MGTPSVTSNLSGFGCFIEEQLPDPASCGIYVVDRRFQNAEESVVQLTEQLYRFSGLGRRERIMLRNKTERLGEHLDWAMLNAYCPPFLPPSPALR